MSQVAFKIRFDPRGEGRRWCYVPDPSDFNRDLVVHQRATAECLLEIYGKADNPAWKGAFSIVEAIDGTPAK